MTVRVGTEHRKTLKLIFFSRIIAFKIENFPFDFYKWTKSDRFGFYYDRRVEFYKKITVHNNAYRKIFFQKALQICAMIWYNLKSMHNILYTQ